MAIPRSLLLITVDCLRADHTGFMGYERPTTPFMDSLAKESVVFRNAMAGGVPTYYAFPALMASRYPLALGRDVVGLAPEEVTLASALQESGYATAAFVAANPYLSSRFGYQAGFDTFVDFLDSKVVSVADDESVPQEIELLTTLNRTLQQLCHQLGPLGRAYDELYFRYGQRVAARTPRSFEELRRFPAAHVIVDQARHWLAGIAGQPFFLWLHFMDPHIPYYPPAEALDLIGRSKLDSTRARYLNSCWNRRGISAKRLTPLCNEVIDLYDAGIRWVDAQLSRLVSELQGLGLWDQCAVAFTADHGEEFLDHGGCFHSPSKVYEELAHVPLLVRAPSQKTVPPIETPFSLVDLAPTLLEIVDVPAPFNFRGVSRWSKVQAGKTWQEPARTECVTTCTNPFHLENRMGPRILGLRETNYKLVVDCGSSTALLFDLDDDPKELRPLDSNAQKPVRGRLLDRARSHLADSLRSRDHDRRLAAQLRDLRLEWATNLLSTAGKTSLPAAP